MLHKVLDLLRALYARPDFWGFVSIPIVAAVVTWAHVWFAMKMVFYPVEFVGFLKPWLGWQGIVPRKAPKMAGILVDNTLAKVGTLEEVFHQMEPERIARHISDQLSAHAEEFIDELVREHGRGLIWENLPPSVRKPVYDYVRKKVPEVTEGIVKDMGANIDDLMDFRRMVIRRLGEDRALMVFVFQAVGDRELKFLVDVSFWIGLAFGVIQMLLWVVWPKRWALPVFGAALGCLTNWVALNLVFRPLNPIKIGPFTLQGVFLRRQHDVSKKFADLATEHLLSVKDIMTELLAGPRYQQTSAIIRRNVAPLVEGGFVGPALQIAFGPQGYLELKRSIVEKATLKALEPLSDPTFNRERATVISTMFAARLRAMTPAEFQSLLRPAFHEDEWILIALGAVMGFLAGLAQLLLGFN